jgi:hypothetical protein
MSCPLVPDLEVRAFGEAERIGMIVASLNGSPDIGQRNPDPTGWSEMDKLERLLATNVPDGGRLGVLLSR